MIFFTDKNNPNYIATRRFREQSAALENAPDEEKIEFLNNFIQSFYKECGHLPGSFLVESMSTFLLKPYIGSKTEDYKILSVYSLERRESKQTNYIDEVKY